MSFELINVSSSLIQQQAVKEIENCNAYTAKFGLSLSRDDAIKLVETRKHALKTSGRIEFGGGAIDKIIRAFCDSPYISTHNYVETIHELTEMFYLFKNETIDLLSDDELIDLMKNRFDGVCQGSLELLEGRELYKIAKKLKYGYQPSRSEEHEVEEENEYDEY